MTQWFSKTLNTWFTLLKGAIWNSTSHDWDDDLCTWNGISPDAWYSKTPQEWQTNN